MSLSGGGEDPAISRFVQQSLIAPSLFEMIALNCGHAIIDMTYRRCDLLLYFSVSCSAVANSGLPRST
jgi:hypothetical protein